MLRSHQLKGLEARTGCALGWAVGCPRGPGLSSCGFQWRPDFWQGSMEAALLCFRGAKPPKGQDGVRQRGSGGVESVWPQQCRDLWMASLARPGCWDTLMRWLPSKFFFVLLDLLRHVASGGSGCYVVATQEIWRTGQFSGWIDDCPPRVKERPWLSARMVFLARVSGGCPALFQSEASKWRADLDGVYNSVDSWYCFLGRRWCMARPQTAYWRSESLQICEGRLQVCSFIEGMVDALFPLEGWFERLCS
ncbi:hypothetical protein L7F22_042824 [Adiantum nelumboides]|nr:hypothetical protein [Adiantum nelumboides]